MFLLIYVGVQKKERKKDKGAGQQTEGQMNSTPSPGSHLPHSYAPLELQSVSSDSGTCPNTQSTAAETHTNHKITTSK